VVNADAIENSIVTTTTVEREEMDFMMDDVCSWLGPDSGGMIDGRGEAMPADEVVFGSVAVRFGTRDRSRHKDIRATEASEWLRCFF